MFDWKPSRRATLHDVARLAGVSVSVVSSVLNGGCANTRSSETTRERVRKAANELGYRPNDIARSLRYQVSNIIGFYNGFGYIDARNPFINATLAGLHARCDYYLCDMLVHRLSRVNDTPQQQMQEIIGGKVDGVVLYTRHDDPIVAMLAERRFPAVAVADSNPLVPSVTADDVGGSRMVAERLAASGHKRVLYRMPPLRFHRASADARLYGFGEAAAELGIEYRVGRSAEFVGELSEEEIAILSEPDETRPTAIASWVDGNAFGAYNWLKEKGWTDKFDVIGFDGFEVPRMPCDLSTIVVDWHSVAWTAVDVLRDVIAGNAVPSLTTVPVTMHDGETG
jgi:LacI family transcriptional regulator